MAFSEARRLCVCWRVFVCLLLLFLFVCFVVVLVFLFFVVGFFWGGFCWVFFFLVLRFPPLLHRVMVSAIKIKLNKCDAKLNS